MASLTLLLPGAPDDPPEDCRAAVGGRFARAASAPLATAGLEAWLADAFSVAAPLPAAALTALAEERAQGALLRADPVHFRVQGDGLVLCALPAGTIADADASALVASLNRHFEAEGLAFSTASASEWLVRWKALPLPATRPLRGVCGLPVFHAMPEGQAVPPPRQVMNEAQMLFFDHPVNRAREQRGQVAISGVWLWGEGDLPPPARTRFSHVRGDDAVLRGLAKRAGARLSEERFDFREAGAVLLCDSRLDFGAPREAFREVMSDTLLPAFAALDAGRVEWVEVVMPDLALPRLWRFTRSDRFAFWRSASLPWPE